MSVFIKYLKDYKLRKCIGISIYLIGEAFALSIIMIDLPNNLYTEYKEFSMIS